MGNGDIAFFIFTLSDSPMTVCRPFSSATYVGPYVEDRTLCNTSPFGETLNVYPLMHSVEHGMSGHGNSTAF